MSASTPSPPQPIPLLDLCTGFLMIGLLGFSGIAQSAQYVMVERRKWLSPKEFVELFGICAILPGGNILNASVMIGGDEEAFERAKPVLLAIGPKVTRIGGNGLACQMKIAVNLLLMVEIIGSGGLVVQQMVYVRTSDGTATRHVRRFRHHVDTYADERLVTPDGFAMRMPKTFTWSVQDDDGSELITIQGTTNGDFRYGLGAGYAGSYAYTGTFRGEPVTGTAYQEWIDRR